MPGRQKGPKETPAKAALSTHYRPRKTGQYRPARQCHIAILHLPHWRPEATRQSPNGPSQKVLEVSIRAHARQLPLELSRYLTHQLHWRRKMFHNVDSPKRIFLRSPKAKCPTPTTYPDPDYVAQHLAQFQNGASRFMTQTNLEKYGIAQKDSTSFIMLGHEATELLAKTAGEKRALEQALG